MLGNDLDDVAFAGARQAGTASRKIEVVYLDSDAAARERIHEELADHHADITATSVATTEAALEAAASMEVSCLVLDPSGLGDIPDSLVSNDRYPVVLYTDAATPDSVATVFDDAETVVRKRGDEQLTFLAEKIVSVVSASADRTESALQEAVSGIESRTEANEIAVLLAENGTVQWSSEAVSTFVHGLDDTRRVERFYDAMRAALPNTPSGRRQLQRLRDSPTEPVAVRIPGSERNQYLLRHGYELPDAAGGLTLVLLRDVTETARRDARTALLDLLIEQAQDGLYTLDERGVIDFCNESFAANLGYEPTELCGKHASAVLAPGELSTGQATVETLLEASEQESTTVDLTFCRKDGTEREVSINYTLVHDDGDYSGLIGVARDVTERKRREREYQELTERLNFALEGAELGVWDWNPKTNDVTFDERWTGMLGYARDELEPHYETWADLVHPDDLDRAEQALGKLKSGETDLYQCEFRMRTKDGDWRWIRDIGKVFEWNDDGEAIRAVGIHQDITEERRRQDAIERQRDELATLNGVNMLIQDLIHALGGAATRHETVETVCERIVESDRCELAWIGERAGANDRLVPKTVAGDTDVVLDDLLVHDENDQVLCETALVTGTVQTIQDCSDPTEFKQCGAAARTQGFKSAAAIPLVQGNTVHGVLCVYADQPAAFSGRVADSFAVLGKMVGYTLAAVQNRQLLSDDTAVELTFESRYPDIPLVSAANAHGCRIEVIESVETDPTHLLYVSVHDGPPDAVAAHLCSHAEVLDSRVVRADGDSGVIELQVTETVQSLLLDVGARCRTMVAVDGTLAITVEAPPDADSRAIQDAVADRIPDITLTAKQTCEQATEILDSEADPHKQLTDRQQEVLRTAFLAGYYAWPRDTSAEQLAETLDIASPTLLQHLRRAERNLIDAIFDI
ncbi:PAS domain S-box protein [Haloarcula sp. CBA1130]|uniref:PAS domain S-box protein n=1 Tax=unclassified Haloarcula TaxID=2624677 RepID=UPI001247C407|nr:MULTISPECIES: PAS domain S-box protein [unclassified Haloarcula]KAA9398434.1 PAS domain S-box protein [Haloarcula sp. CBA1129]KAA9401973.1 PAS domain S-box protein [Haloarcula sp. CBA1130]